MPEFIQQALQSDPTFLPSLVSHELPSTYHVGLVPDVLMNHISDRRLSQLELLSNDPYQLAGLMMIWIYWMNFSGLTISYYLEYFLLLITDDMTQDKIMSKHLNFIQLPN